MHKRSAIIGTNSVRKIQLLKGVSVLLRVVVELGEEVVVVELGEEVVVVELGEGKRVDCAHCALCVQQA